MYHPLDGPVHPASPSKLTAGMNILAVGNVVLEPGGLLAWLVVGLIAGAVAGRLVRGHGLGCLTDIVVGVVGAFLGGLILSFFVQGRYGFLGSIVVAVLGATILLAVLRLLAPGLRR